MSLKNIYFNLIILNKKNNQSIIIIIKKIQIIKL